jgi:hypothetical protein
MFTILSIVIYYIFLTFLQFFTLHNTEFTITNAAIHLL